MARIKEFSLTLATADDDGAAQNQTPGAAGNLTLNGALVTSGVAIFDVARRVRITTASDESAKTLTIYGTDRRGDSISETMTGPNATTGDSLLDYKTVTQVAVSAAFTGNVRVGTGPVASTPWYPCNHAAPSGLNIGFGVSLSSGASMTYSIEHTFEDVQNNAAPYDLFNHDSASGKTANHDDNYAFGIGAMRLTTSVFSSGTATLRIVPQGN